MTDDKIALRALLEKGSDATFLREMIGFAAERLMELESESLCGAGHGERSADRRNPPTTNTAPSRRRIHSPSREFQAPTIGETSVPVDSDYRRPAPAPSSCVSRSCAGAATSRSSSSPAAWPRRR
jgi:hypothetical protein